MGFVAFVREESRVTPMWGPEDCQQLEWLHLQVSKEKMRGRLEGEKDGQYLIRTISPPFMREGKVVHEVKFVGYDDTDAGILGYLEMLDKYGMDEEFMEWVWYWFNKTKGRQLHQLIVAPLTRVQVRFLLLLSSFPIIPLEV